MSQSMFNRIIRAYHQNEDKESPSPMWDFCVRESKKTELTIENLENFGNNSLNTGFFWERQPDSLEALKLLAEAVGVRGIQNPEGAVNPMPKVNESMGNITPNMLMSLIQKAIGINFQMDAGFDGNKKDGIPSAYGFITARHCYYLLLLKRILEQFPSRKTSIIEIGAGAGILGYFLDRCGYKDYTIIDLARTNAVQAYFLSKNLPDREIILSGEVDHPFSSKYDDTIRIYHVNDFAKVPIYHFDLMVNMDGLTEMPIEDAKGYINSDCAFEFLSVNHEQNDFRAIEIYNPELKILKHRYPFHARPGYVEELYELKM